VTPATFAPISCAEFAVLKARRVEALAALSSDPVLSTQTGVAPSQDKVLRELERLGLALRAHASDCRDCYLNHHLSPGQVQIEINAAEVFDGRL
jgi:hypothetical protein